MSKAKQPGGANARRMIGEMSNARTLGWVGVALGVHVVLIGGTSLGYIRDRWIDPAGAEARRAAEAATAQPSDAAKPATSPATPSTPKPAAAPTAGVSDDEKRLAEVKDKPGVKKITEAAKPSELPKSPSLDTLDTE